MDLDWSLYPNFSANEMRCKHTKELGMRPEMMQVLQDIRTSHGKPIFVSSGYRSKEHPLEQDKREPGEHTLGLAVDIICYGREALALLDLALKHDVRRIGLHQKGMISGARYMHIGIADRFFLGFVKTIWTY